MQKALATPIKLIRYVSIGLFLVSLACPCFDTGEEPGGMGQGGGLLLMGILWFFAVSPGFVWLANPLLFISWMSAGKKRDRSFITSITALLVALCFLFYKSIIKDEGGSNTTPITAHLIGYWVWLASMLTMVLGNFYMQLYGEPISGKTDS